MLTEKENKRLYELLDLMSIANENGYSYYVHSMWNFNNELWDVEPKDLAILVSGNTFNPNDKYFIDDLTNENIKSIKDDKQLLTELEKMEEELLDFVEKIFIEKVFG
ncbi:hypothetical protein B8A44_07495 [Dolosigranulum pigrum]|uniref:Uncharacterized protein n=1 Tax=Dolosigranulum pigrum TaxID=29394 RepID=A0A328KPU7_9LACT|nr:hypothetical protein [Dolosigranulum pigrum]RAN62383.1 hypothetical protein B8A44_07495 [Dolosigranulum pigrum]